MKIKVFLFCLSFYWFGCTEKQKIGLYPVIDVVNKIDKYQRVYCSDFFSSIELIPLETEDHCLLDIRTYPWVLLNERIILMRGNNNSQLYAFDRYGKFMKEIGKRGQGPAEYTSLLDVFFNMDKNTIYVDDFTKIIEFDFNGRFIRSFSKPHPDNKYLTKVTYAGENIFVGQVNYDGNNRFKYCLFNQNGDTVKTFPSYIFFDRAGTWVSTFDGSLYPVHIDNRIYLKDYINDTIYVIENSHLQPAFVFGFSKYSFSKERIANPNLQSSSNHDFKIINFVGMPNYFFYNIVVPEVFSTPKSKPEYNHITNTYLPADRGVYGIFDIERNENILLDTDNHFQKGIINDMNGGLPFIPRYYAGNNVVVDIWNVMDVLEILTDEYFSTQTIKDQQAYKKLRDLIRNLKEDDNPIVVLAKLK